MSIPLPMSGPVRMSPFYLPTKGTLHELNNKPWVCCYSGGKDSTALASYIEWLRRSDLVKVRNPRLVLADTGTEYPFLASISDRMLRLLESCGWETEIVRPPRKKKLFVSIFGRGLNPAPVGTKVMRWCTAQTKIAPVKDYTKQLSPDTVRLTGMRWGESAARDEKLRKYNRPPPCNSGGECGITHLDHTGGDTFKPIESWYTNEVIAWLSGSPPVPKGVTEMIPDLLAVTRDLVRAYEPVYAAKGFGLIPQKVSVLRYGCIACPALKSDKIVRRKAITDNKLAAVNRIYAIWDELRKFYNRLQRPNPASKRGYELGPAKLAVRKRLFEVVLDIQRQAGIVIVEPEDEKLIRLMWATGKCYTRNWSKKDDPTWEE